MPLSKPAPSYFGGRDLNKTTQVEKDGKKIRTAVLVSETKTYNMLTDLSVAFRKGLVHVNGVDTSSDKFNRKLTYCMSNLASIGEMTVEKFMQASKMTRSDFFKLHYFVRAILHTMFGAAIGNLEAWRIDAAMLTFSKALCYHYDQETVFWTFATLINAEDLSDVDLRNETVLAIPHKSASSDALQLIVKNSVKNMDQTASSSGNNKNDVMVKNEDALVSHMAKFGL